MCFPKPWFDEQHKVIKVIVERRLTKNLSLVSLPLESGSVALLVSHRLQAFTGLHFPGVEWWIDIYQIERAGIELRCDFQTVAKIDFQIHHGLACGFSRLPAINPRFRSSSACIPWPRPSPCQANRFDSHESHYLILSFVRTTKATRSAALLRVASSRWAWWLVLAARRCPSRRPTMCRLLPFMIAWEA